jgi:ribosomal protein S27AE
MGDVYETESERRWNIAARLKKLFCPQCGAIPLFANRREFFEVGVCEYCAYKERESYRE